MFSSIQSSELTFPFRIPRSKHNSAFPEAFASYVVCKEVREQSECGDYHNSIKYDSFETMVQSTSPSRVAYGDL